MRVTALFAALALAGAAGAQEDDGYEYLDQQQPDPQQQQYQQQQYPQQYQQGYQQPYQQGYQQPGQEQQPYQQPYETPAYDDQGQAYGVGYYGPHPVPYQYGSGYCYIDGAHSHEYAPFDQYLFREYNGYYYFVGDPVDFGWSRTFYWFNGNHPIPLGYGGGYCYISWPHRHHYMPIGDGFSLVGGYYTYSGIWPADYYVNRTWYWNYYGGYYRNSYYGNRYYTVRPPPIYAPAAPVRINAPPGRTFVGAPPARVAPRVGVGVAAPRVGVGVAAPAAHYNAAPVYRAGTFTPAASGFHSTAAPAYHPSAPAYHAPAPAYHAAPSFRAAPARVGGFHR